MRIRKSVERWFDVDGDPDGAKVKIKHLTPGEIQDIADKVVDNEIEYKITNKKTGERTPVMRQKARRSDDLMETMLACVKGWENFYDEKDDPLKFNKTNLKRAVREIEGFAQFVADCRKRLSDDLDDEKQGQEKN